MSGFSQRLVSLLSAFKLVAILTGDTESENNDSD